MNILLFAYHFPPLNDGGVRRPVAMKKYLSRLGHKVTVVTHSYQRNEFDFAVGEVRLFDLHRTGPKKFAWFWLRISERVARLVGINLSRYRFWAQNVRSHLGKIASACEPHVVMATYPPAETLELGLEVSKMIGVPFVADFRDGLLFEPLEIRALAFRSYRIRLEEIERRIAEQASAIVTVSKPISDYFSKQYVTKNVVTIPNGFDPEDTPVDGNPSIRLDVSRFNIVYTGRFSLSDHGCDIRPFLAAAERAFLSSSPDQKKIPCIHIVGDLSASEFRQASRLMRVGLLKLHPSVSHEEALAVQKQADVLLLITSTLRTSVATGKVFEYLQAGRPILGLTAGTYAEQIIRETGSGWIVPPHDRDEIAKILSSLLNDPSQLSSLRPDPARIASFSRPHQMVVLSNLLESLSRSPDK